MTHVAGTIFYFWTVWFWIIAWPVSGILRRRYPERIQRGAIHKWMRRKWGPLGPEIFLLFLCAYVVSGIPLLFIKLEAGLTWAAVFWTVELVWVVVDYITGGDEPGKRVKKLASALKKKFVIAPKPRPVINLG